MHGFGSPDPPRADREAGSGGHARARASSGTSRVSPVEGDDGAERARLICNASRSDTAAHRKGPGQGTTEARDAAGREGRMKAEPVEDRATHVFGAPDG